MWYPSIVQKSVSKKKQLALLVDPDKYTEEQLSYFISLANQTMPDCILVGGSFIASSVQDTVQYIKTHSQIPVILFPGNSNHLCNGVDALLLLSLLSGRNAEFLIGQHVLSAFSIRHSGIETISTGYILIDGGCKTSVEYISNTQPIPRNKKEIVVSTAIAGELIGNKLIYLEAGSGALYPVPKNVIEAVKKSVSVPLIVGGGIQNISQAEAAYNAGADMLVVGNALEKNPDFIKELAELRNSK